MRHPEGMGELRTVCVRPTGFSGSSRCAAIAASAAGPGEVAPGGIGREETRIAILQRGQKRCSRRSLTPPCVVDPHHSEARASPESSSIIWVRPMTSLLKAATTGSAVSSIDARPSQSRTIFQGRRPRSGRSGVFDQRLDQEIAIREEIVCTVSSSCIASRFQFGYQRHRFEIPSNTPRSSAVRPDLADRRRFFERDQAVVRGEEKS